MGRLLINSKAYGKRVVLFDDKFSDVINSFTWRIVKNRSNNFYTIAWTKESAKKRKLVRMHQLITGFKFVDHINGNGLDNRLVNLRNSNHKTNAQNRNKLRKNKTSKYKGVFRNKQVKKISYIAKIIVNGKSFYLGSFSDEKSAALAYNEAALKYFGEFASLNKI